MDASHYNNICFIPGEITPGTPGLPITSSTLHQDIHLFTTNQHMGPVWLAGNKARECYKFS